MGDTVEPDTRERILAAAAAMISEDGVAARLSVRAVAARAGVSLGALRHHFPTQLELRDEVMRRIHDWLLPEIDVHDATAPARDRLVACLRRVLELSGSGSGARATMGEFVAQFVTTEPTPAVRQAYLSVQADGRRRIEGWLRTLAADGDGPVEDIPRAARFLDTVLQGLALQRALPVADGHTFAETETLYVAVDAVLGPQRHAVD